ncbi:uncharacterized protein LOC117585967 [Drosophila guanche]|nr:uncharacterized protein LOC117585967 [Drosophila guanche]XP_034660468.1 uncharacterized protein LOC117896336 [Drosophila subobscura]XP_041450887.1 uncharacterized protein LOC121404747 [Drosophila obscura]
MCPVTQIELLCTIILEKRKLRIAKAPPTKRKKYRK